MHLLFKLDVLQNAYFKLIVKKFEFFYFADLFFKIKKIFLKIMKLPLDENQSRVSMSIQSGS